MSLRIFPHRIKSFLEIYLSPAERLSEIIFGLIMVLTITSTLKIALTDGEAGIRTMAIAALGCNAAWGIVDGAMYILSLIHISEPTRLGMISYAVFCLKKKKKTHETEENNK